MDKSTCIVTVNKVVELKTPMIATNLVTLCSTLLSASISVRASTLVLWSNAEKWIFFAADKGPELSLFWRGPKGIAPVPCKSSPRNA